MSSNAPLQGKPGIDDDLAEAIGRVGDQYRGVTLKIVEWFDRKDDYLSFIPKPGADESWASGGQVIFHDPQTRTVLHSGEVEEYDPDTGAVYVDVSEWEDWQQATRCWIEFRPFNFGEALNKAFETLSSQPEALEHSLRHVTGNIDEDLGASTGSRDFWALPWGIVWGPPGTGKTETVSEYLARWAFNSQRGMILVATPTNNAADQMALRLKKHLAGLGGHLSSGHSLVHRGGRGAGGLLKREFPECLRDPSFSRQHAEISAAIEELEKKRTVAIRQKKFTEAARLKRQIAALQAQLPDQTQHVIGEGSARILIVTTFKALNLAASGALVAFFDKVVIDEAGMVSRAVAAAITTMGKTVCLAGDPKQIGPIFKCPHGVKADVRKWLVQSGLSHLESALEASKKRSVQLLRTQYRMHPEISKAVSEYCYDGMLLDGASVVADSGSHAIKGFPESRASWVVVDAFATSPEASCSRRATPGTGHIREASAEACVTYGQAAARLGQPALILSPYRAQVRLIREKLAPNDLITVGTIHRQQGAEREVVILDLVNGASAFSSAEIRMMLNVAMSRAKHHLIVIASKAELRSPVLRPLATLLKPSIRRKMERASGFEGLLDLIRPSSAGKEAQRLSAEIKELEIAPPHKEPFLTPRNWGHDIAQLRNRRPLFSAEQVRLIEKNVGEGHRLVRGVAGSGKSLILTAWAAKMIQANPSYRVLITYFNKGMKILLQSMIQTAADELSGGNPDRILRQVTITHSASISKSMATSFDAVFVDEAQDMDGDTLRNLYNLCLATPKGLRNFVLFADDSQNIYGKKTLAELRGVLPEGLDFRGRSDVLRETYRSTQTILSLAVNLALDPKDVYQRGAPQLLEYMRVRELAQEGLLVRPEDSPDGAYSVCYTEREGVGTRIFKTRNDKSATLKALGKEIKRLAKEEGLALGDFMIVTVKDPERVAEALNSDGIKAKAFGGKRGQDTLGMPGAGGDFVRCTTVFTSKGHESPIGVFMWPEELEEIQDFMKIPDATAGDFERIRRCMLYVSVSRAMFIQYIFGAESRFMKAADVYRRADSGRTPAWT